MNKPTKLADLPDSRDEYWEGAEQHQSTRVRQALCAEHELIEESRGVAVCRRCSWGSRLAGWQRIDKGKVIDLREVN